MPNLKLPPEMAGGEPAVAHLTPATAQDAGTLTAFPSGRSCTYRSSNGAVEKPGLYEILDYEVSTYMAYGQEQASLMVGSFREAAPTSKEVLRGLLQTVTGYGEDIYIEAAAAADSVEQMYDFCTDEEFLQRVDGIGETYAENIAEKVRTMGASEMRLYAILRQYGIPYNRSNKREKWTRAYFQVHTDRLDQLEENPYVLLSIADLWRQSVKEVAQEKNIAPVGYRLDDIDGPIIENEPRFSNHRARLSAHLSDILNSVYEDGHTVASVDDSLSAVRDRGFEEVRESLSDPAEPLGRDLLLSIARESPGLTVTSYRTPEGRSRQGITTPRHRSNKSLIQRAVVGFRGKESPFPSRMRAKMIRAAAGSVSFSLTEEQKTAIRNGFQSPISAVSGPAGSGKTTVTTCFLKGALLGLERRRYHDYEEGWTEQTGRSIYVTAPTGTAVQRIRRGLDLTHPETDEPVQPRPVGEIDANATRFLKRGKVGIGTLHSFLGYRGEGQGYDLPEPHPCTVYVDEMSMGEESVAAALCEFIGRCQSYGAPVSILMAGDANQLPPVGQGFPFRDLLGGRLSAQIPTTRLSEVMRQSSQSAIIDAANRVLEENPPPQITEYDDPMSKDFGWVEPASHPKINPMVTRYSKVLAHLGYDAEPSDIQVVLPLRNQSSVQPSALYMRQANQNLQRRFAEERGREIRELDVQNPERPSFEQTQTFSVGDRVMHVGENEYDPGAHEPIMRGATGRIVSIGENMAEVDYPWIDGRVLYDGPEDLWGLGLAYCLTCHAAQGSEFDYELLSIPKEAGPGMIDQSWLYTAITRAKKDLRMVAPKGRIRQAVRRNQGMRRQTLLTSMEG